MLPRAALLLALVSTVAAAGTPKVHAKSIAKPIKPAMSTSSLAVMAPQPEAAEATAADPFEVVHERSLSLKVSHELDRDAARERVAQLLNYWDERFGVKSEWHGFRVFLTGTVLGIAIRALFEVETGDVLAMAEDPGTIFSGAARRYVDGKLRKYLHPTYQEQ